MKKSMLAHIGKLYNQKVNIMQYLKSISLSDANSLEDIMIGYDFQAGSYTKQLENTDYYSFKQGVCQALATTIEELGNFSSILEAGVGEATTLGMLMPFIEYRKWLWF